MAAPHPARPLGVLVLIALSTPLALGLETVVRRLLMPPDFEQVRAWLAPVLTPWAWATVPLTALAIGLGWWLFGVLVRRELRGAPPDTEPNKARAKAELESIILASSAPQVPAVIATLLFMMGAPLLPVAIAMGVATLGVLSLGWRVRHAGNFAPLPLS